MVENGTDDDDIEESAPPGLIESDGEDDADDTGQFRDDSSEPDSEDECDWLVSADPHALQTAWDEPPEELFGGEVMDDPFEDIGDCGAVNRSTSSKRDLYAGLSLAEKRKKQRTKEVKDRRVTPLPPSTEAMIARSVIAGSIRTRRELSKAKLVDSPQ